MARAKSARKSVVRKKQQMQRKQKLLGLFGMVLFALVLVAGGSFWYQYLSQPGKLPLRVIEIQGDFTHLQRGRIEQRVAKAVDGGFFTVDMSAIRAAVIEMPWVGEVSVRRVWPDTLRMLVTEQQPLAYWGDRSLLNLRGEIFHPEKLPGFVNLPRLQGADRLAPEMVEFYLRLYPRLIDTDLQLVDLQLNARREWYLQFSNGLQLMLGRKSVEQRLQNFLRVYPQLSAQLKRQPERIDMRYEHGFAVKWLPQGDIQLGAVSVQRHGSFDG